MNRRGFLAAGTAAVAAAACGKAEPPLPPGAALATRHDVGHRLRDGGLPAPGERRRRKVVIVGAGVAGLSAAWRFRKSGFDDFELLELERSAGGNAAWGENEVSAFPWGAHYVPLPTRESRAVRLLLKDLGVLHGDPAAAAPRYDERALCFTPQERVWRHGVWHDGLVPLARASDTERDDWRRFHDRMEAFKRLRGADGARAFAVPMARSSRDPKLLALDRGSMRDWLVAEGHTSGVVHWLVNYACRDDYGCDYRDVSAWAGIHYFASRDGYAQDADPETVLTWPEGNGWIVRRLLERYAPPVTGDALVYRVEERRRDVGLDVFLAREDRSVAFDAEHVVWAAPLRFAGRALANAEDGLREALAAFDYAPWLVANLTLAEAPYDRHGAPLAWDNVLYDSTALGYVVATHQSLDSHRGPTVLTWYQPLATEAPRAARERLLATPRERWAEAILAELAQPHPEIRATVRRIDVAANGHAMVRPTPGFVWGDARRRVEAHAGRVHFAHSDASGFSLFEEAQYRGVAAAERVLARLGVRTDTFL
jgi:predicted NAD/FAD-dependent oxidoreductase